MALMFFSKLRSPLTATDVKFLVPKLLSPGRSERTLWGYWLNAIFNAVDPERVKEVGPDRACAEWCLKNGASVKWKNKDWEKDYNSLPKGNFNLYTVEEIDATESSIMHVGFAHLKGLRHLRKIKLHKCACIDDEALRQLNFAQATLQELEISSCGNVTDKGLLALQQLTNLKHLYMYDLVGVKKKQQTLSTLQKALNNCKIDFPNVR